MTINLLDLSFTGSFSTDILLVYALAMFFLAVTSFVTGRLTVRRFERRLEERLRDLRDEQEQDEEQ